MATEGRTIRPLLGSLILVSTIAVVLAAPLRAAYYRRALELRPGSAIAVRRRRARRELGAVTMRDAVLARVAHLSAPARRILETISIVPARVEPWLLEALGDDDTVAVGECLDRGVLRSGDAGFSFRHELARRAIEESLHVHHRRQIHARVLDALRRCDAVAGRLSRLAYHAEQAGDVQAVLELAPKAARESTELGAHREPPRTMRPCRGTPTPSVPRRGRACGER
jgi:hypothetical protein